MLNLVDFSGDDVRAVMSGNATRRQIMCVLTSQTCGEPCWHAAEDVCRCSCGGRNHGCLVDGSGKRPERTSRIDGHVYVLRAVGEHRDMFREAGPINAMQWRHVEKPFKTAQGFWMQYKYSWSETDPGAPARVKFASESQMKWKELTGWKRGVALLWVRKEMPEAPRELVIDDRTGEPLADQSVGQKW